MILNRPHQRNAADLDMQEELPAVLAELAADDSVGAVVLSGRGAAFSAGGDRALLAHAVAAHDDDLDDRLRRLASDLLWLLLDRLPQPLVVAVHGYAIGWGASLAALADLTIIERDAYLQEPHGLFGLPPSPGCEVVWGQSLPPALLKEVLMFGRRLSSSEAERWGLVNDVVAPGAGVAAALELASRLATLPPAGVAAAKRAANRAARAWLEVEWPRPPV